MENASKALIMAGAVLVAIVIISIGVSIISSQKGTIDQSEETSKVLQVKTYNSSFEQYAGTNKGSVIKDLLSEIQTNNNRNATRQITITYGTNNGTTTAAINTIRNLIRPNKNYKVSLSEYDSEGYIKSITITD